MKKDLKLQPLEEELLSDFRVMCEGDQDALVRVAQYLAQHPSNGNMTPEMFEDLFLQMKLRH